MELQTKSLLGTISVLTVFCLGLLLLLVQGPRLISIGQRNSLALQTAKEFPQSIPLCYAQNSTTIDRLDPAGLYVAGNTDSRQLYFIGWQFWLKNKCWMAQYIWQEAASLSEDDKFTQFGLALSYYVSGEILKSREAFVKMNIGAELREWLALQSGNANLPQEKLYWLELSFWAYPSRAAVRRLDKTLTAMSRDSEARFYYNELVALVSDETFDYWWAKGALAEMEGNWEDARLAYTTANAQALSNSDRETLYTDLARVYRNIGDEFCANYFSRASKDGLTGQFPPECHLR